MAAKKSVNGRPEIDAVVPPAAIPGGEFQIRGRGLSGEERPRVRIGEERAPVVIGSENYVIARVPEGAIAGDMTIDNGRSTSEIWSCDVGLQIADSLHPVANPAVDRVGNVFAAFSGPRGQKTPVAVYQVDLNHQMTPFVTDVMNATGLAFDSDGVLYISSRQEGIIYQAGGNGDLSVYVEGMGVATGLAFDMEENLYVGDRSGTIFKISRDREIYVYATLEASIAAYHLAFGPEGYLYVTGPTTSSFDSVYQVSPDGEVEIYYRGLGRPQGLAFDIAGNLYVAASLGGRKGVVRVNPDHEAELFLWAGRCRIGVYAVTSNDGRDQQRPLSGRRGYSRPSTSLNTHMNAEIIAVGSELLTPSRVDTNSLYLTGELNNLGVEVVGKAVIGDDRGRLSEAVRDALRRSEIVLLSGGLGPTEDDITRDGVAGALGRELVYRQELCDDVAERFRRMNKQMAEINKRQAYLVEGGEALDNPNGTAPGQWIETGDGKVAVLLPGPPRELKPMFENIVRPRLEKIVPPQVIRVLQYRVSGIGESDLDALIAPIYKQYTNPVTTVLAAPGDVQIHLRARCDTAEEADNLLAPIGAEIEELLGDKIYARSLDSLAVVVGRLLRERDATLAVAESCSAGMLAQRITDVSGASDYFLGGFLVYSPELKQKLLGVDAKLMEAHSVVSAEVAEAMAAGARDKTGATYTLSVTGEAGPESATGQRPGTVFIGLAGPQGVQSRRFHFLGARERIRLLASQMSMDVLRRELLRTVE